MLSVYNSAEYKHQQLAEITVYLPKRTFSGSPSKETADGIPEFPVSFPTRHCGGALDNKRCNWASSKLPNT